MITSSYRLRFLICLMAMYVCISSATTNPDIKPNKTQSEGVNVSSNISTNSEIERISGEVDKQQAIADSWDTWNLRLIGVAGFIALGLAITAVGISRSNKKLSDFRDQLDKAKDRQLQSDLKSKDGEIALLGKSTAEINLKYEEERRARLSIENRLADRTVTPEQRKKVLAYLSGKKPERVIVQSLLSEGREALQYANEIADVFASAGWDVVRPTGLGSASDPLIGISMIGAKDAEAMRLADIVAGALIAGELSGKPVKFGQGDNRPSGNVEVWVGGK